MRILFGNGLALSVAGLLWVCMAGPAVAQVGSNGYGSGTGLGYGGVGGYYSDGFSDDDWYYDFYGRNRDADGNTAIFGSGIGFYEDYYQGPSWQYDYRGGIGAGYGRLGGYSGLNPGLSGTYDMSDAGLYGDGNYDWGYGDGLYDYAGSGKITPGQGAARRGAAGGVWDDAWGPAYDSGRYPADPYRGVSRQPYGGAPRGRSPYGDRYTGRFFDYGYDGGLYDGGYGAGYGGGLYGGHGYDGGIYDGGVRGSQPRSAGAAGRTYDRGRYDGGVYDAGWGAGYSAGTYGGLRGQSLFRGGLYGW